MSSTKSYQKFEVLTAPLQGSNLIEASAGTGKTYSIAILVLRLLLEKKLLIQEILMVTFTKAAVAELEERIRIFVRAANRHSRGEEISNGMIRDLVDQAIKKLGKEEVQQLLNSAVINLDETSVMTIHGFCQQTLNEFAFETGQLFSAELVENTTSILEEEIQAFWRTHITSIRTDLLKNLIQQNFNQSGIAAILNGHLSGKNYIFYNEDEKYEFGEQKQQEFFDLISIAEKDKIELEDELVSYIQQNAENIKVLCEGNTYAKNSLLPYVDNPNVFIKEFIGKKDTGYANKLFPEIVEQIPAILEKRKELEEYVQQCLNYLYSFAIQEIVQNIEKHKISHNLLSFDDMIFNLHKSLVGRENLRLEEELQNKYKAVFIDEFQDTDKLQFEVFRKAFQGKSILFYIGDPKQSIYGWRKADIATYFKARNEVDNLYSMNVNYRSTHRLIEALNRFFLPEEDFDTFHFSDSKERFDYHRVDAPEDDGKGKLVLNGEECVPVSIRTCKTKPAVSSDLTDIILDLLTNEKHSIYDSETKMQRKIRPSDIGVLVRANKDGLNIKAELSKVGIPAVTVSEAKILESAEAKELIYILDSMVNPTRSKVNRALLSSFLQRSSLDILNVDEDKTTQQFRGYLDHWKLHGVYSTLMDFISDFGIQQNLIAAHTENGERIITNLFHLVEILYKTENRQNLSPVEVVDWLKVNVQKEDNSGDEKEQRVENDEDAVKIVSIHKSKGLQYNIVFAPTLDFNYNKKRDVISFRNENGEYVTANKSQVSEEDKILHELQDEQENRRLLYVALTRTVYKCFIHHSESGNKSSTLRTFLDKTNYDGSFIEELELIQVEEGLLYVPSKTQAQNHPILQNFHLKENYWQQMSYTRLAASGEWKMKDVFTESENAYDRFIFKDLRKGAKTGNFLHYIFENLDFIQSGSWENVIGRAMRRFVPNENADFQANIIKLVDEVMNASIKTEEETILLSSLPRSKCLHEMEFDFPVDLFTPRDLEQLLDSGILISSDFFVQIEGMMNGKIDLFFEHNAKYYILDWKSNYLGPNLSDYSKEKVEEAMSENNYHLQYLIYTYAVQKYLKQRLGVKFDYERDFGGAIYLFVRGMRKNQETGVFYHKPAQNQLAILDKIFQRKETQITV